MENPIKMDDLGVPLFLETPKSNDNIRFWVTEATTTTTSRSFAQTLDESFVGLDGLGVAAKIGRIDDDRR